MRVLEIVQDEVLDRPTSVSRWTGENDFSLTTFRRYQHEKFPDLDAIDLLIVHGGIQHLWNPVDAADYAEEIAFVKSAIDKAVPVVGFCMGAQVLAEACGEKVYRAPEAEIGWYTIRIRPEALKHPLVSGLGENFTSFLWHHDHFPLPLTAMSLAQTRLAANQIIAGTNAPWVGYQFHPEYTREFLVDAYRKNSPEMRTASPEVAWADFTTYTKNREDPYALFKKLLDNAVAWFSAFRG